VKGLRFANVQLRTSSPDLRHAMVLENVETVAIDGLDAGFSPGAAPMLKLVQARGALIRGCQPRAEGGTFVQVLGDSTRSVVLTGNDLDGVERRLEIGCGVPRRSVSIR
jgi:hypothetical protein